MKHKKTIEEIEEQYDLEIDKIIKTIKKQKASKVLLQFPDGLKSYALAIKDKIQSELEKQKTKAEIFIWLDSCFGACDVPLEVEKLGIDLIVQFGHSAWDFKGKDIKILK